jgi:hypothetical protein
MNTDAQKMPVQHNINPLDDFCVRCGWPAADIQETKRPCVADEQIDRVEAFVTKWLDEL